MRSHPENNDHKVWPSMDTSRHCHKPRETWDKKAVYKIAGEDRLYTFAEIYALKGKR